MEQRRAIFGVVRRIEEPSTITEGLADADRSAKTLHFETGETARLLTGGDARLDRYHSILQSASRARIPIYVLVGQVTNTILDLRIPLPADIVTYISEIDSETLEVQFYLSQARHFLRRSNPDFGRLLSALEKAHESQVEVIITENHSSEIIDAREVLHPFVLEEAPARGA